MTIDKEFQSLIPPLSVVEYEQLEANLRNEGCRDPLVTWNGMIIDGHNRHEICTRHGIKFDETERDFPDRSDVIEWIIRNQFGRRNLNAYERTKLVLRLESTISERAKAKQSLSEGRGVKGPQISANLIPPIETREELAKLAGVSHDTVAKVKRIESKGTPELKSKLANGEITVNKASKAVAEVKPSPIKIIQSNGMGIFAAAKSVMERIADTDTEIESAMSAMIGYCNKRLSNNKKQQKL